MQQFKTYPGIPPSGVVERPSILRIPPFLPPPRCRPLLRHLCFFLLPVSFCMLLRISAARSGSMSAGARALAGTVPGNRAIRVEARFSIIRSPRERFELPRTMMACKVTTEEHLLGSAPILNGSFIIYRALEVYGLLCCFSHARIK